MQAIPNHLDDAIARYHATRDIAEPKRPSIRDIALEFTVPHNTLSKRISGLTTSRSLGFSHLQVLTVYEEDALFDYIRRSSLLGHPPTPRIVYETAEAIRDHRFPRPSSPLPPLGKHWLEKFRKRHPGVASVWSRQLVAPRFEGITLENLTPWFAEMGTMINRYHYSANNIYNMDETGYGIGLTQSTRVLVIREAGAKGEKATKVTLGRQEWVTTIECVSASGRALPPLVIFKAVGPLNTRWIPDGPGVEGWRWTTSNSGWTNDTLGFEWLERVFEPCTNTPAASSPSSPPILRRLLILDGHGSHVKARFVAFCVCHKIDLMVLPSHTSHKTQPLDVGIFGPLKAALARETDRATTYDHGSIAKDIWASRLAMARHTALTEHNIHVGWRETGIFPFSPKRLLDKIPSASTSPSTSSRQPLASLPDNNLEFLRSNSASWSNSVKERMTSIVTDAAGFRARETVLEIENKGLRDAAEGRKRKRGGINVSNLGTHIFTSEPVLRQMVGAEALTASRKGQGKG